MNNAAGTHQKRMTGPPWTGPWSIYRANHSVKLPSLRVYCRHSISPSVSTTPRDHLLHDWLLSSHASPLCSYARTKCPMTSQGLLSIPSPSWNTPEDQSLSDFWSCIIHAQLPKEETKGASLPSILHPCGSPQCQFSQKKKKKDLPPWQWQFLVRRKGLTSYWKGATWEVGRVWKHLSNSIERMLTPHQALDVKDKTTRQVFVSECFVFLLISWTRWCSILGALTKPWIKCEQKYYALISKVRMHFASHLQVWWESSSQN